jgi:hypothetical protein
LATCEPIGPEYFNNAPVIFSFERELNCTPAELFAIFEDEHSWPKWAKGIEKVVWNTPRPFGVGTVRTVSLAGNMEAVEKFFIWDSGKRMAFYFTELSRPMWSSFAEDYRVTDLGNGRCVWNWTVAYTPRGFLKLIHPLIGGFLKKNMTGIADGIGPYIDAQKG